MKSIQLRKSFAYFLVTLFHFSAWVFPKLQKKPTKNVVHFLKAVGHTISLCKNCNRRFLLCARISKIQFKNKEKLENAKNWILLKYTSTHKSIKRHKVCKSKTDLTCVWLQSVVLYFSFRFGLILFLLWRWCFIRFTALHPADFTFSPTFFFTKFLYEVSAKVFLA